MPVFLLSYFFLIFFFFSLIITYKLSMSVLNPENSSNKGNVCLFLYYKAFKLKGVSKLVAYYDFFLRKIGLKLLFILL